MHLGFSNPETSRRISSYAVLPSNLTTRKLFNEVNYLKNSVSKPILAHSRYRSTGDWGTDSLLSQPINELLQNKPNILPPLDHSRSPSIKKTLASLITPEKIINCVTRCSYKTKTGSVNGNLKPENQDSFIIKANILGTKGIYLFAVCDGHGPEGHRVSRFIKEHFGDLVEKNLINYSPLHVLEQAINKLYEKLMDSDIDLSYSGSTLVSVLVYGDLVVCANVGDSRAIIANKKSSWSFKILSHDHKPENETEASRILNAGGRIKAMLGPDLRIWLADRDAPGLSITRSIGDLACRSIGLISKPEIIYKRLIPIDQLLILASDGIWKLIDNQETVEFIGKLRKEGKSEKCCEKLVNEAIERWREKYKSIDDITVIVVFLHVK
ncbi:hypothetical protein SteCoe_39170 [Stentor coeruleus]|uniref:PPM-type phosphatase domain-containing protein n=1 Tax=Stentor coeruleus TaxID=5963 RepID=A0A1R2AKU7_9CILI|nr:hypothetical protein SteCoe_39170 [Stentor coeruleus]